MADQCPKTGMGNKVRTIRQANESAYRREAGTVPTGVGRPVTDPFLPRETQ